MRNALLVLAFLIPATAMAQDCPALDAGAFARVRVGEDLDHEITRAPHLQIAAAGAPDWPCLVDRFEALGPEYSMLSFSDVGPDHHEVYRFMIHRKMWWEYVIPVPGGENGRRLSIFITTPNGRIAWLDNSGLPVWIGPFDPPT